MLLLAASSTSGASELSGFVGWVADVIAALGSVGVGVLTLIENLFPPIPSEVVLPLAGYLASVGRISLVGAIVASTIGSLFGAVILFELASRLGKDRLRRLLHRVPLLDWDDVDRADDWFERHGTAATFFGRFVPGVRSLVSIPAGTSSMGRLRFWFYTTLGSAIWNTAFVLGGYALGSSWTSIGRYSDWLNYAIFAAFGVAIARFVCKRRDRFGRSATHEPARESARESADVG